MPSCRPSVLFLPLLTLPLPAQTATTPAARYSSEPYVIERASTVLTMHADGTADQTQTFVIHLQTESAVRTFGIVALAYAKGSGTGQIAFVRVHHTDGSTQETPVSDAIEQPAPVTREAPFYSDLVVLQLPVKNLRVGDTLDWQSRSSITHPEIPNQFYGQGDLVTSAVILDQSYELRTPLSTHPTIWTNPRAKVNFAETSSGSERVDRWSTQSLDPTVGPEADARRAAEEKRVLSPEEALDAREGKLPQFAWTTFPDWAAVGAWYSSLARDRATPDSSIRARVAELTAGATTDQARAEALYAYVSTHIRYIGVAFGIGRYQPHTAAEVLSNQYGDCKDKHTLLAAMLAAANLPADPALIGAGIRFNPAVPSPNSFNHLITHLTLDGKEVWLDSTAGGAPWQALQPVLREEQALVMPAAGPARIEQTPLSLPYPAYTTTTVTSSLDPDLTGESEFTLTVRDDDETGLRGVLHAVSPSDYGTFVQNLMGTLGFAGTTSQPTIDFLNDTTRPLTLRFHYHRTHDASWGDNRVTALFGPIDLPAFSPDKPPTAPIQLGEPRTLTSTAEVTLPRGWGADLPAATHAHTSFATVDTTYRMDHGKLLEERKVVVLQRELPAASFKQYQSWYETAGLGTYPYLQLVPAAAADNNAGHTAPPPSSATSDPKENSTNAQAADLVTQAGERIHNMDTDGARKLLDQARALNPAERGLWTGYAAIADINGSPSDAAADLERELTHHPDETRLYGYLIEVQARRGDQEAAIATARRWSEHSPDSPEAATALVIRLSVGRQYGAAETAAEAAVVRLQKTGSELVSLAPLLLAKADTEDKLGEKARAAETVAPLLPVVSDPMQINSVAYFFAEADRDLPAAETAQRKALQQLEDRAGTWSLGDAQGPLNHSEALLGDAWDTLGWILYREHKPADALPYLEAAAVLNSGDKTILQHLQSVATAASRVAPRVRDELEVRTFPLGPAKGRRGTAELRLVVAEGKVLETESLVLNTGESTSPKLADGDKLLLNADLHQLTPPGSKAHLVRSGIVSCLNAACQLILIPLPTPAAR